MYKKFVFLFLFFASVIFANDCSLLYLGGGINNARRKKHSQSTEFRAEYKFRNKWLVFHPLLGSSLTTKKQFYGYGGIALDLILKKHVAFVPNFVIGYYNKGEGKDLGFPIEFRTGIELSLIFNNQMRLGAHVSHTSNASIGRKNPGLETLNFFLAIPIRY
jgi:lipid A 3-O-deacylase